MTTQMTGPPTGLMMGPTTGPTTEGPPMFVRRLLRETGYAVSALFIAVPAFALVVVNLSLGLGLSILVGGILLIALATQVARGVARFERLRVREMLGRPAPTPAYLCPRRGETFWRNSLLALRDPQSWLDVLWCLVGLVTAVLAFVVTVVWWAVAAGGLTYWFWQRWLPEGEEGGLAELLGLGEGRTAESLLNLAVGVLAVLTLPFAVRLAAGVHAGLARLLLTSRAELQEEVRRVAGGRDAARVAEAASMRRLERDIHDGPQQRLVRLTMDLGRARRQLEQDPERVAQTLDGALAQARETVDELRSLSRGIAPPLLVDRGLRAAVEQLVAGWAVPVELEIDVPDGLPPHVETAAYFVVSEALTNVAKHSGATRVRVDLGVIDGELGVRVEDDGIGGAHPGKGLGLAGLQQRLVAVDGRMAVESPTGGPTVVRALVPLGER